MKKPAPLRLEATLIDRAKKLAEKNKKKFKLPDNFSSVIEQALAEYLTKNQG
jgi:hypothetical protein